MEVPSLHPIFAKDTGSSLYVANAYGQDFYRYQQFAVSRDPKNLRLHVQLIFSLIQQADVSRDAVFGALLDLFIVLQDKGLPLRQRMLVVSKPFLAPEDITFFEQHLQQGANSRTLVAKSGRSQFCENYSGQADAIKKAVVVLEQATMSVYEEALSLIEYGELDEAAILLEQALKQQPNSEQIAEELLTIYLHQENDDAIDQLRDWFFAQDLELPKCWPLM